MTTRVALVVGALLVGGGALGLGAVLYAELSDSGAPRSAPGRVAPAAVGQDGKWGTVKGQLVFAGDKLPVIADLQVDKDQDHCLAKGPLKDGRWVINAANKGIRNGMAFLRTEEEGGEFPVHPSLKAKPPDFVVDQPMCMFEPRVFGLRADQKLVGKNSSPKPHNIVIQGFENSLNCQLPPGRSHTFEGLTPEPNAIPISCGAHGWMKGYVWVFEHPYFAVTDKDGNFEIKLAPAGKINLVVWHEGIGYVGTGKTGKTIEIKGGETLDLGKIELKPKQ